ncbi:MAG: hypothetical protein OXN95_10590, partial [bacterium]|nr:hypothetical protein [bacterium]
MGTEVIGPVTYSCSVDQTKVGSNCVKTLREAPTYRCPATQEKVGSDCITKTKPTYSCSDNQQPTVTNRCIIKTKPTYSCSDNEQPTVTNRCIIKTAHTVLPTYDYHVAHDCPTSHSQTPPLPLIYFVYTSETPELMTHEQLNEYVKNGGLASSNPGKWEKLDATHNCYKAVEDTGTITNLKKIIIRGVEHAVTVGKIVINNVEYAGKIVINNVEYGVTKAGKVVIAGVEHAVDEAGNLITNWRGVIDSALDAVDATVNATLHAYKVVGDTLQVVLCAPLVGTTAAFAAGVVATSITGNAVVGVVTTFAVGVAISDSCDQPTVFDQIELLIYLAVRADGRAKVKAYE